MIINNEEKVILLNGEIHHCALDVTMHFIGGKWKTVVLWYLKKEKKRFSELKKHIPDITEKMLSLQLKALEEDGIVKRTVYAEVPPRVEYELTAFGKTMIPMLEAIALWGRELSVEIEQITRLFEEFRYTLLSQKEVEQPLDFKVNIETNLGEEPYTVFDCLFHWED